MFGAMYKLLWLGRIVALPSPAAEIDHDHEDEDEGGDDEEGEGEEAHQHHHQQQQQQQREQRQEQRQEERPATRTAAFPSDLVSPRVGAAGDGFHKKVRELAVRLDTSRWKYLRCCGGGVIRRYMYCLPSGCCFVFDGGNRRATMPACVKKHGTFSLPLPPPTSMIFVCVCVPMVA